MAGNHSRSKRVSSRRQFIHRGGRVLSTLMATGQLTWLQQLQAAASISQRGNSCVFIFLFGGPSHIDLWDMKPAAPLEIRGEFRPISTRVADIQICEHLPRMAQVMDHLCLLRSMTHKMPVHGPACSEIYSGRPYFGPPVTDQATPEDWPSVASLVNRFSSDSTGLPRAAVLPWYSQFNGQDRRIAGQTGGRMGEHHDPFLVEGDPVEPNFDLPGLQFPADVTSERFETRRLLRQTLNSRAASITQQSQQVRLMEDRFVVAERLIRASREHSAFSLQQEPASVRDRYGRTKFGQSLLLARRMVESGIAFTTVNWDDESKSDKVSPHWDTHHDNFPRLKNSLCPIFDQAFPTFIQDLHERGLLDSTLVVAVGEFGRTPRIGTVTQNGMTEPTGRDHWPHAFTALLAGGGVQGGQIYGATNPSGGYVDEKPVTPADLSATILNHLGIAPDQEWYDRFQNVQRPASEGRIIADLTKPELR